LFADLRGLKNRLQFDGDSSANNFSKVAPSALSKIRSAQAFVDSGGRAQKTLFATRQTDGDTGPVIINKTQSGVHRFFDGIIKYPKKSVWLGAIVLLLLTGLTLAAYRFIGPRLRSGGGIVGTSVKAAKLTTTGTAARAAISPDGRYVVHAKSEGGKQSLWVKQVATASNVQIVEPGEIIFRGLTFSPDGNFIYYVVQEGGNPVQALYQIAVLGGAPRKITIRVDSPVTVSPDGAQIAFVRRDRAEGIDELVIAAADGSNEKILASRRGSEFFSIGGPAWSPDGRVIACGAGSRDGGRAMTLIEVGVADGREKILADRKWFDVNRVEWVRNGGGLMMSALEQNSNGSQIWHVSYPDSAVRKVTNDFNDYRDMSLTSDSNSLVAVQFEARVNVWMSSAGAWDRPKQLTTGVGEYDGVRGLCWLAEDKIVYVSRVSGSQDIWTMNANGEGKKQLTTVATRADVDPSVPRDGRFIIFTSNRLGNSNVWRIDADGNNPKQLTKGTGEEFPSVSPDGKIVVYTSTVSSKFTLWKVSTEGGEPVQLTDKLSQWPAISPDGKFIACWYREDAKDPWRIAVLPIEGGEPLKIYDVAASAGTSNPVRWSADGRAITYIDTRDGVSNIWSHPLDGGGARAVTDFKSEQIFWFDWSRDGKNLLCARGSVTSDAILLSGFGS
jgi:Tol biopolymer transport system component